MVKKIISGGQTGADQAGLEAAHQMDLQTGGWMPAGFRTATGPRPDLAEKYGLRCSKQSNYYQRTLFNVRDSDATVVFGRGSSAGSKLTLKYAKSLERPHLHIPWETPVAEAEAKLREFLSEHEPQTLNIAGNREEKCPGISAWVKEIIVEALATRS